MVTGRAPRGSAGVRGGHGAPMLTCRRGVSPPAPPRKRFVARHDLRRRSGRDDVPGRRGNPPGGRGGWGQPASAIAHVVRREEAAHAVLITSAPARRHAHVTRHRLGAAIEARTTAGTGRQSRGTVDVLLASRAGTSSPMPRRCASSRASGTGPSPTSNSTLAGGPDREHVDHGADPRRAEVRDVDDDRAVCPAKRLAQPVTGTR